MMRLLKNRRPPRSSGRLDREAVLHPSPDVLTARSDGAMVLLDMRSEQFLGLDETAVSIWKGIEAGAPLGDIVHALGDEFDADVVRLEADTYGFVGELLARRLVVFA